jgi:hypothetical protein
MFAHRKTFFQNRGFFFQNSGEKRDFIGIFFENRVFFSFGKRALFQFRLGVNNSGSEEDPGARNGGDWQRGLDCW